MSGTDTDRATAANSTGLTVDGAHIACAETGAGEPVIALHCSASSGGQWRGLVEALGPGFRVLAPDLLGCGHSDPWPGQRPLRLLDDGAVIAKLIGHYGEPAHLVGHSYGGAVALRAAVEMPEQVRSLTLIEPVCFHLLRDGRGRDRLLFSDVGELGDAIARAVLSGDYCDGMSCFVDYWSGDGAWARLGPERQAALAARAGRVALDFWATVTERLPRHRLRQVTASTLVIAGSESPEPVQRIAEILSETLPVCRRRVLQGANHMAAMTRPDTVYPLIADHIRGSGEAGRGAAPQRRSA